MNDLVRIPNNVTVEQNVSEYLIEWKCCLVAVESSDEAQTVIDLLAQIEALTELLEKVPTLMLSDNLTNEIEVLLNLKKPEGV